MSRADPAARWSVSSCGPRWRSPIGVHPNPEIGHPAPRGLDLGCRDRARVLLESGEQNEQVAGSLIEDPVPRVREADPQLPQLTLDLRRDGVLRRRCIWGPSIQMLFESSVDLRDPLRRKPLDESRHRLDAVLVTVIDRLRPCHAPSIANQTERIWRFRALSGQTAEECVEDLVVVEVDPQALVVVRHQ